MSPEKASSKKLPRGENLTFHDGYWYPADCVDGVVSVQERFSPRDTDVILITLPKSGTTWLQALAFTVANRARYPVLSQIRPVLLTADAPHALVPILEITDLNRLEEVPSPRILATHIPYTMLPDSVRDTSNCRVVYLCRNPLDQFGSGFVDLDFDRFCQGFHGYGPFWDHILGAWKASQERPDKVLFLKYEDVQEDTVSHAKALAEFMGFPFSVEEESDGVVEEVLKLCKNENGHANGASEVGVSADYLTPAMAQRMKKVVEDSFEGSGLRFKFSM